MVIILVDAEKLNYELEVAKLIKLRDIWENYSLRMVELDRKREMESSSEFNPELAIGHYFVSNLITDYNKLIYYQENILDVHSDYMWRTNEPIKELDMGIKTMIGEYEDVENFNISFGVILDFETFEALNSIEGFDLKVEIWKIFKRIIDVGIPNCFEFVEISNHLSLDEDLMVYKFDVVAKDVFTYEIMIMSYNYYDLFINKFINLELKKIIEENENKE